MFTTVAFSESQDAGAAFVKMAAVPDQHVRVYGDGIYIPEFNRLMGACALIGTTGTEARLVSPSLRRINPFYIAPVAQELYFSANFIGTIHPNISIPLDYNEALELEFYADPAAAEQGSALVWLSDSLQSPVSGRIHTVNAEVTLALVAGSWSFAELDWVDELPTGLYDVVGARLVASTAVGFRFVPVGAKNRPGAPCAADEDLLQRQTFRHGRLGKWFTFDSLTPPGVEVLSSAAAGSATYQLYVDIIPH